MMMTFYHAQPAWGTDQDTLAILYRVSPDSAWHYIASWNNSITSWQADTVMLPNTTATYQVAFMAHSGFGLGILLDSIVVYGTESCTRPTFTNVNVGATSIAATWNSPASAFDVAIRRVSAAWPEPTRVTTHNYTFANLEPNTRYEYRVRSICSDTSASFWATGNRVTDTLECYVPEGLEVETADYDNVTVTWEADATGHSIAYVVSVFNSSFSTSDTVYGNQATIGGLNSGVTYNVTVQAKCSGTTYSAWTETVSFTTPTCTPVDNVTVSDITSNSAVVDWNVNGGEESWIVTYGFEGFNQGEGTTVTVNAHPYTITGLLDEMNYQVYVRAACAQDVTSVWSAAARFTTLSQQGINAVEGGLTCTIYPNPTSSATTISVSGANGKVNISVVDVNGRTVATEMMECAGDCVKQMSVDNLAQGTYFVHIVSDNINMVKKLVVR